MGKPTERTLTALLSPFAKAQNAPVPVLLMCGRADHPVPVVGQRLIRVPGTLTIGRVARSATPRRAAGDLLLDDALVSGRHARVSVKGGAAEITDLDSKNGCFVDGRRIEGSYTLTEGARIFIGNHALVFRVLAAADLEAIEADLAHPLGPVATASPVLARLCHKLRRLAAVDGDVLIGGETGVGKEVYARVVHAGSGRTGRFVAVNCAALPRELVESELFGYRAGAHSTAQSGKTGLIEEAEGGTLFLDEIGEMPMAAQSKLLRFLQDKEIAPLGATRPRPVNVRVIAATNRPVSATGGGGALRADLVARLGATTFTLPPLRERIEDLGALVAYFLREHGSASFEPAAFRALCLHEWPLNVRELEKVLAAALAFAGDQRALRLADFPDGMGARPASGGVGASSGSRKPAGPAPSRGEIETLLTRHQGQVADVARSLGRQRAAVWRWIKQFGIKPDTYRARKP